MSAKAHSIEKDNPYLTNNIRHITFVLRDPRPISSWKMYTSRQMIIDIHSLSSVFFWVGRHPHQNNALCDSATATRSSSCYHQFYARNVCKQLRVAQPKRWIQCLNQKAKGGPICGMKKQTKSRKGSQIKCSKCKQHTTLKWLDPWEAPWYSWRVRQSYYIN